MIIKILDLSQSLFTVRENHWKSHLPEFQSMTYEHFEGSVEDFVSQWNQISNQYQAIILTEAYHEFVFSKIHGIPASIYSVGMADALIKNNHGDWVPYAFTKVALLKAIGLLAPELDTNGIACLTGSGDLFRCGFAVLNQLGFSRFRIVNDAEIHQEFLVQELNKYYFGIDVRFIGTRDLTIEENSGVVLINTLSGEQHTDLLESLSYLNFIRKGGLVVDFDHSTIETQLIKEALRVGLRALHGLELCGFIDYIFLSVIFGQISISSGDYLKSWNESLKNQS